MSEQLKPCIDFALIATSRCIDDKAGMPWFKQIFSENCSKKSNIIYDNCVSIAERTNMFELKDPSMPSTK
jgi:hypothetical protein